MTLQLADKSITRPLGIAKDVLVKVDTFLFPIDFVVMDIKEDDDAPLILGRPFMKTARMMINVDEGVMKVRVQDEEVNFILFEAIKHPTNKGICYQMDALDKAIKEENIDDYRINPETPMKAFILKEEMEINTFPKKRKGMGRICQKANTSKKVIHDIVKKVRPIKRHDKTKPHDSDVDDWIISQRPP